MQPVRVALTLASLGLTPGDIASLGAGHLRAGPPPAAPHRKVLSDDQLRSALASAADRSVRDAALIGLAVFAGARQVELRRLRARDVDIAVDGAYVELTGKGGARRTAWVPEPVAGWIVSAARCVGGSGPVFALSRDGIRKAILRHLAPAAPTATPHDLRHTFATSLLRTGATLEEAMEVLGHVDVGSHEVYAAVSAGWLVRQWNSTHPLAGGEIAHIHVPGRPNTGRMARGVERDVPCPARLVPWIRLHVASASNVLGCPRTLSARVRDSGGPPGGLMGVRTASAVAMTENGAHPFVVATILGVSPKHVVAARFDRRGPLADAGRRAAIVRGTEGVIAMLGRGYRATTATA